MRDTRSQGLRESHLEHTMTDHTDLIARLRALSKDDPLHLSRILHELAGSASLCWEPKPEGVFATEQALAFVESAITELRGRLSAGIDPATLPRPRAK